MSQLPLCRPSVSDRQGEVHLRPVHIITSWYRTLHPLQEAAGPRSLYSWLPMLPWPLARTSLEGFQTQGQAEKHITRISFHSFLLPVRLIIFIFFSRKTSFAQFLLSKLSLWIMVKSFTQREVWECIPLMPALGRQTGGPLSSRLAWSI